MSQVPAMDHPLREYCLNISCAHSRIQAFLEDTISKEMLVVGEGTAEDSIHKVWFKHKGLASERWFLWCHSAKPIWSWAWTGHKGAVINKQGKPTKSCFTKPLWGSEGTWHWCKQLWPGQYSHLGMGNITRTQDTHSKFTRSLSGWAGSTGRGQATSDLNNFRKHHHCEPQQEWRKMVESLWKPRAEIQLGDSPSGTPGCELGGTWRDGLPEVAEARCIWRKQCLAICTVTFCAKVPVEKKKNIYKHCKKK